LYQDFKEFKTTSLLADSPCEKETYQHQGDKSGEAPKRNVPGYDDAA